MGTGTCWRCGASEDGALSSYGDPRDAEIARLKAEVEDLIKMVFADGERAGIEPGDLSPSEVLTAMVDDLAAHKRALAAGPAALRAGAPSLWSGESAAREVERAQAEAMKEGT